MVTPAYQPGCTLEPLLETVELRAKTVTLVYSYYERGEKRLKDIELPIAHWRLMDHAKVRNVGAMIIDLTATTTDDEPAIHSADLTPYELGSY